MIVLLTLCLWVCQKQWSELKTTFSPPKAKFSAKNCENKHKVSRTIMITTFWKISYHKSSMVVPWERNKERKNSRVFSNFACFWWFSHLPTGFQRLHEAQTTFLWLKKSLFNSLRLQEAGFTGLTRRSFPKRKRNETLLIFSSFWKIPNFKFQNFPTFWLPFWLSQVTS